ncbi:hypothetical protein KEM55_007236, partial [Ascosphaera atra]
RSRVMWGRQAAHLASQALRRRKAGRSWEEPHSSMRQSSRMDSWTLYWGRTLGKAARRSMLRSQSRSRLLSR